MLTGSASSGFRPRKDQAPKVVKAPSITKSPWAALTTPQTPKIRLRPMATRAYMVPRMSPNAINSPKAPRVSIMPGIPNEGWLAEAGDTAQPPGA